MLTISPCKWGKPLGGEYVDGTPCVYTIFIWCIPGALGKGGDAFGDAVGDFGGDLYLAPVIVYKDHVTVMNVPGCGIFRMDPEPLWIQFTQA